MSETAIDETTAPLDELGPVDYLIIEFPAGEASFNGEMASSLSQLAQAGTIRILDLLVICKGHDGVIDAFEIDDFDNLGELRELEAEIAEVLAASDITHLAAAMENGTTAGVLVWENSWAAPFAAAARRAGGQLVASGRVPIQAIAASIEADPDPEEEGA